MVESRSRRTGESQLRTCLYVEALERERRLVAIGANMKRDASSSEPESSILESTKEAEDIDSVSDMINNGLTNIQ